MTQTKKYWAFISYSSKDRKWGSWLHSRLENYPIPKEFRDSEIFDGAVLGKNLRPIFRDRDELSGSAELGPAIDKALKSSRYLIVLCSKNSAQSEWVNKEIEDFRAMGGEKYILALILDGEPNATSNKALSDSEECFPPALRYPLEPLAGDLRKEGDGKERGFLKVLAGITQLDFDDLYRRHERAQKKKRMTFAAIAALIICMLSGLSIFAMKQKEIAFKERAIAVEQKSIAEQKTAEVIEEKKNVERQKSIVEKQREIAEQKTKESLISLSNNYLIRGKQSFLDGSRAESLLFLDKAEKTWPSLKGLKLIQADNWLQLRTLLGVYEGQGEEVEYLHFSNDGEKLLIQDRNTVVRKLNIGKKKETLLSQSFAGLMNARMILKAPVFCRFQMTTSRENSEYLEYSLELFNWLSEEVHKKIPWSGKLGKPSFLQLSSSGNRAVLGQDSFGKSGDNLKIADFSDLTLKTIKLQQSPDNFRWCFADEDRVLVGIKHTGNKYWLDFYNLASGEKVKTIPLSSFPTAFTSHGRKLWLGLHNGEVIEFSFEKEIGERRVFKKILRQVAYLQYNENNGLLLASGTYGRMALYNSRDGSLKWQVDSNKVSGVVRHAYLSPSCKLVAIVHQNKVSVFDLNENKLLLRNQWNGAEGSRVVISDDDKKLAVADVSGIVRVWTIEEQLDLLQEIKIEGENQFIKVDEVSTNGYLIHGRKVYKYNAISGDLEKVYENSALQYQQSIRNNLFSQSNWGNVEVRKSNGSEKINSKQAAINQFLKDNKTVAGILFEKNGFIRPYSAKPDYLSADYESKKIKGKVYSAIVSDDNRSLCASYTDGYIVFALIDSKGINKLREILLPEASNYTPSVLACTSDTILLNYMGRQVLLDVEDLDGKISLPIDLQSMRLIRGKEQTQLLSQDSYGQVKLWDRKGNLLYLAKSPVYQSKEQNKMGGGKNLPGEKILISPDGQKICTSFGAHIFIWSLDELKLLWRSPVLIPQSFGSVNIEPLYWNSGQSADSILIGIPTGFGETWSKILHMKLPMAVPSSKEVEEYLENRAGISLKNGQVIDL